VADETGIYTTSNNIRFDHTSDEKCQLITTQFVSSPLCVQVECVRLEIGYDGLRKKSGGKVLEFFSREKSGCRERCVGVMCTY